MHIPCNPKDKYNLASLWLLSKKIGFHFLLLLSVSELIPLQIWTSIFYFWERHPFFNYIPWKPLVLWNVWGVLFPLQYQSMWADYLFSSKNLIFLIHYKWCELLNSNINHRLWGMVWKLPGLMVWNLVSFLQDCPQITIRSILPSLKNQVLTWLQRHKHGRLPAKQQQAKTTIPAKREA